jgi:hypothetical protein
MVAGMRNLRAEELAAMRGVRPGPAAAMQYLLLLIVTVFFSPGP